MRLPRSIRTRYLRLRHRSTLRLFADLHRLVHHQLDRDFYLTANPDVRRSGKDPVLHFIRNGWKENRRLSINDDGDDFLARNGEIAGLLARLDAVPDLDRLDGLFEEAVRTQAGAASARGEADPARQRDVLFVGYVEAGLGLGEVLRSTIGCYRSVARNFSIHPFGRNVENRYIGRFMPDFYDRSEPHLINVFEMSIDQLDEALADIGEQRARRGYNILKIYWELSRIPQEKVPALQRFDEIWAPSGFVREAVEEVFEGPVTDIPPHVDVTLGTRSTRADLGLPDGAFLFLCSFDYNSALERKNPQASLRAFADAFPKGDASVGLVFKTNRPEQEAARTQFLASVRDCDDPRVVILDRFLDRDAMLSLIAACDCYLSLHRSEGFGLGMAEALAFGRPVVATDYSANRDFVTAENGYPVRYRLVPVEDDAYLFGAGQSWAEPDHAHAVAQMRRAAGEKGSPKPHPTRTNLFGRERVAGLMKARIDTILAERRARASAP